MSAPNTQPETDPPACPTCLKKTAMVSIGSFPTHFGGTAATWGCHHCGVVAILVVGDRPANWPKDCTCQIPTMSQKNEQECPRCGSPNFGPGEAFPVLTCGDCNASWTDSLNDEETQ